MIKSIELRNWKTHRDTRLSFSRGTNIMVGHMGSGKSSVMDAISFALFGTFPALNQKKVNTGRLIRSKPRQEKEAWVRLELELGGETYSIKRELSLNGKAAATIEKNGSYLQSQPERVTEEVERILRVDYDLFCKAVYSEQNRLDYFMELRASDRKKQIDGLLGLDRFATAQDNATTLANRLTDMAAEGERLAREFDSAKAAEELGRIKAEVARLVADKEEAEAKLKLHEKERSVLEAKVSKLKELRSEKISLSKEIEGVAGRIELLGAEIKKLESRGLPAKGKAAAELESIQARAEALRKSEASCVDAERKAQKELSGLEAEASAAKKDLADKEKIEKELGRLSRASIEKMIAECGESVDKKGMELSRSRAAISEAQKQMKELEGNVKKCPVCETDLDEHAVERVLKAKHAAVREHTARSGELEAGLAKAKAELKELNSSLNAIAVMESKAKGYAGSSARLAEAESGLSAARKAYDSARKAREENSARLQETSHGLEAARAAAEAVERMERHASEREGLMKRLGEMKARLKAVEVDDSTIDSIQSEIVKANSEIGRNSANLASAAKYLKDKEAQLAEKRSDIERMDRVRADVSRKKDLADNISKFKLSLAETQTVLRAQLVNSINEVMREVWEELYPYGDYQGVELDATEDGYSLRAKTISDGGYAWEDIESIASGGERSTACLAMRIAFSLVLVPNLKWLILDEPTHNIDSEGISKFVRMFSETLPGIIDQVFIITHDDVLKQVSNAKVYVFRRNKKDGGETEVSEA